MLTLGLVSDGILDAFIENDIKLGIADESKVNTRLGCETLCTTNKIVIAGEGRGQSPLFHKHGAKVVVNDLGAHFDGTGQATGTPAQEVVAEVCATLGGLHILVCGAGIARRAPLAEMSEADWDDVVDVSLKGAFNYVRAAAPVFRAQRYGKIVCVGSINGLRGRPGTASYNAAKAGLVGLVKTAAAELGAYDVNVNLVAPGFIETTTQVDTPRATRDLVLSECAIKRLGTPADVAAPIVFLASDAARHVTGQVLRVDAGQYL